MRGDSFLKTTPGTTIEPEQQVIMAHDEEEAYKDSLQGAMV